MQIGDRIRARRKELKLSQEELANIMGYKSRASINKIELSERRVPINKVADFAVALKTTSAYLMGWESSEDKFLSTTIPVKQKKVPMLGEVACGEPIYTNEETGVFAPMLNDISCDFCLIAKGDSMINARINDGDIVFIRKTPTVRNGDIAVVLINDEATLKRVYYDDKNHKMVLQAENPIYAPMVFVNEELKDISIIGRAVAFQSRL